MKKMILSRVTLLQLQKCCIPFLIGAAIGLTLYTFAGWWGFLLIFPWIGFSITLGCLIAIKRKGIKKDLGRRICLLMISPLFLLFLGICQRENLQLEEFVFYLLLFLQTGMIVRVFIHFCIAKIFGPFIWGRGFCGWACWTAALMEWLPIKENRKTPTHLTRYRYLALIINIGIPLSLVWLGYDWVSMNINELPSDHIWLVQGKPGSLICFVISNTIYYGLAIWLAFKYRKRRAFCKIACPVSLFMKCQTKVSLIQPTPSGNPCISCGICNKHCPMDVNVMSYISEGKKVKSSECILCGMCSNVCPKKAIK